MAMQTIHGIRNNERGFTLVELLIAALISIIVLGLVAQVFTSQRKTFDLQNSLGRMVANGRGAVDLMQRTVQNAGYQVVRGRKFLAASDRYVTVVYDADDDGAVENTEVYTYAVSNPSGSVTESITISPYFDQDGDGAVSGTEQRTYSFDLQISAPPYNLYQYIPNNADAGYTRQVVAENIDYVIFRYFDAQGNELGDDDNNPGNPPADTDGDGFYDPPFSVPAASLDDIRRVTIQFMVRTSEPDPRPDYQNSGTYPVGSVGAAGGATYADAFHRQIFFAEGSPRNLALAPWGKIQIVPASNPVTCPTSSTSFTATLLDGSGEPIPSTTVNFNTSDSANVTLSPTSGTSNANGEVTGTVTYNWNQPSTTITVSANSQLTISGEVRPIYNAVPVAFTSGTGIFIDDFADGANDWTPENSSAWDSTGGTYKIFPLPSGQVQSNNPQTAEEQTVSDTISMAYTVPSNLGNNLMLVAIVAADATAAAGGNPTLVDTRTPIQATSSTVSVNSRASNDKRAVVLVTSCECENFVSSATVDGQAMTLIRRERSTSGPGHTIEMWVAYDAQLPSGAGNVTVQYSGPTNSPMMALWSLENVVQTVPSGGLVDGANVPNGNQLPTLTVTTTQDNAYIISAAGNGDECCNFDSHTPFGMNSGWEGVFANSARFSGSYGVQATAGAVNVYANSTSTTQSGYPRRGAHVVAAFEPASSFNVLPSAVTFNGTPMNVGPTNQAGTGPATGVGMYWLPVSPGDSGNIVATFSGNNDERRITAMLLYDVQGMHATQRFSDEDATGGDAQVTLTPDASGQMIVTGGHHKVATAGTASTTGTGHNFTASGASADGLLSGGMGAVVNPASGTSYTVGFSNTAAKEREVTVGAVFEPAPVTLVNQISTTGCSPWTNYEMQFQLRHNTTNSTNRLGGAILRYQDNQNYYWLRLEGTGAASQFRLKIIKVVAGAETELGTTSPMTITDGAEYFMKVYAVGDDLKAKIWQPADLMNPNADEPTTWNLEVTDAGTTFTGGRVGILVNRGEFVFDNVQVSPT